MAPHQVLKTPVHLLYCLHVRRHCNCTWKGCYGNIAFLIK